MESGQSQFAPLKLRSLALVSSSGAQSAPPNSIYGSLTTRLFPPRRCALVRDSWPFRLRAVRPSVSPSRPVSSTPPSSPKRSCRCSVPEPSRPYTSDRLPAHAPLRSAPYGTARLLAAERVLHHCSTASASASKRLDSTIGQPGSHAQKSVRPCASYHARRGAKRYINMQQEADGGFRRRYSFSCGYSCYIWTTSGQGALRYLCD